MLTSGTQKNRNPARSRTAQSFGLRLTIQNAAGATGLPVRSTVRRWLQRTLRHDAIITVRFVGAAEGRRLNRQFRGRDYATNVLSFGYDPVAVRKPVRGAPIQGDIVLCVPVLRREARAQQKSLRAHCAHLLIHGALHLSGHDHETAKDARVMEALEAGLLDSLGYDDPYATIGESGSRIR